MKSARKLPQVLKTLEEKDLLDRSALVANCGLPGQLALPSLEGLPQAKVVAASGMAGYGSANEIETRRKLSRLYLCGDLVSEAQPGQGLMASRVSVCAGHQANMVLRLLLGMDEP